MLDDNESSRPDHFRCQNPTRNLGEAGHIVGRIGKNDVESAGGAFEIAEHVAAHEVEIVRAKLFRHFLNESLLCRRLFDSRGGAAVAAEKLESDRARTGEEVERVGAFDIGYVLDDIEYILAGEIGSRASGDICRHVETPTAIFTSYYSHSGIRINGKGALMAS